MPIFDITYDPDTFILEEPARTGKNLIDIEYAQTTYFVLEIPVKVVATGEVYF